MKNVLIINAHQYVEGFASGKLNKTMENIISEEMIQRGYSVQHTVIEQGYNIDDEIDKHVWADIIILQSPVYWFGCPWIYKKYVDEVFTMGLVQQKMLIDDGRTRNDPQKQYGSGGKMQGKKYMMSLTWNAPEEAFNNPMQFLFSGKTVDDIFLHNTACYKFCGAEILPSFSCFNVIKEANIEGDIAKLRQHIAQLIT